MSNFEGHVMKVKLTIPTLLLGVAVAVAIGATFLLLQMMPAAAQTPPMSPPRAPLGPGQ